MTLYLKEPYKKKMMSTIPSIVNSKGYCHFFIEDSIVTPAIPNYTKGDIALIDGNVLEVEQDSNGNTKFMAKNIAENKEAEIEINWTHRLQMMQDNISRIILRICLKQLEDIEPMFESTDEEPYFLLPIDDFGFQSLEKLEDLANRLVQSNLPINYVDSLCEKVKIGNYQAEFSYGPKLTTTGECAIIAIGNLEKTQEGLKLYFNGGNRALLDYKRHRALARNLGIFFQNDDPAQIWSEVKKLKKQIDDLKEDKKELESNLGLEEINEFLSHKRIFGDVSYIYRVLNNVNFKNLKNVIQNIQQKKKHIQIYGVPNGANSQIIVASSSDLPINIKKTMDEISRKYSLEGSGNLYRIQANCPYHLMRGIMEEFLLSFQKTLSTQEKDIQ